MIEHAQAPAPVAQGPAASAPDGLSAGALLRRARESVGLHVAALAVSLKVPVRKLEALEEDRYDLLTDAVFVRALASSVCRALKIDPQPVLERLPPTAAPRLARVSEGINAPFRAPSDGAPPTWLEQLTRPVFLAVFALLLGALVLILLPRAQQAGGLALDASTGAANSPSASVQPVSSSPAPGEALTTVVSPGAAAAAVSAASASALPAGTLPSRPASGAGGPAAARPASSAAAVPTAAALAAVDDAAPPPGGIVVFRTKAPSWVEVTDAKGVVAVRKMLTAGEAAAASGALPLQVIIGKVDVTEVQVRGKPFDLRSVSRDNVARFEVR